MGKRRSKRTPSRDMIQRTADALSALHRKVRSKGAKAKRVRAESYARVVDEYIKDVYVPRGKTKDKEFIPAEERRYIADRTSVDALASRKARQTRAAFMKYSDKGKNAGQYRVLETSGRLQRGDKVEASTVARSMAGKSYWNKVRLIRDASDGEIPTKEIRAMLKLAKQAGLRIDGANVDTLLNARSFELREDVPEVLTGPKSVAEAQARHKRSVAAKRGAATRKARAAAAKSRRSDAAKRGWIKRKYLAEVAKREEAARFKARSDAAKRGWITRRKRAKREGK